MPILKIDRKTGLQKISMTKLLRERLGLDLKHAKGITNDVTDGKPIFLNTENEGAAKNLADELSAIGAIIEIELD